MAGRRPTAVIPGARHPPLSFRGAPKGASPESSNPRRWLWIPGSLAALGPRNDSGACAPECSSAKRDPSPRMTQCGLDNGRLAPILYHMVKYQTAGAGSHVRGLGRSDAPGAAGAARRACLGLGQRPGAAVSGVAARHHEAPRRAVRCRPDHPREDRPHRRVPIVRRSHGAGHGMAQPLPALLVDTARSPRRVR